MYCTNPNKPGCRGQFPGTGRARDNHMCCPCDRDVFGPQSEEEKGKKQIQKLIKRGRISSEKGYELLAAFET